MMLYKYVARDTFGKSVKGSLEADDISDFYKKLEQNGLLCVEFMEQPIKAQSIKTVYKLKTKELVLFCRKISTMLASGMSITNSLDIMCSSAEHSKLKQLYLNLYESIKGGKSLSVSMRECGNAFPQLLISMIESGEESGNIDMMFKKLSIYYEKQQKINSKIKTATIYPKVLASVVVIVVVILFAFVLPNIYTMFKDMNLPFITKLMIAISGFIINYWYLLIIIMIVAYLIIKFLFSIQGVRNFKDKAILKIPKFGKLINKIYSARFANTLSVLYASGLSLLNGIHLSTKVVGNTYIERKLTAVMEEIRVGFSLSDALANAQIFDRLLNSMVKIGEETGSLDTILESTSEFYDQETESAIESMLGMLEPIMLILMAIVIGSILIAVMYPIFLLYKEIGK